MTESRVNRNEILSTDSGFSEMVDKLEEQIPAPVARAASEEPKTVRRNRLSFATRKNIFMYLETHGGMDPLKPPNWWIAEEEEAAEQPRPSFARAQSVPSMSFSDSKRRTDSEDNRATIAFGPSSVDDETKEPELDEPDPDELDQDEPHLDEKEPEPEQYEGDLESESSCSSDDEVESEASTDTEEEEYEDVEPESSPLVTEESYTVNESELADEVKSEDDEEVFEAHDLVVESAMEAREEASEELPRMSVSSIGLDGIDTLPEKNQRKIINIINELIEVEKSYVEKLGRCIEIYVLKFDSCNDLPPSLVGKKYHIFGNIERIHAMHRDSLLPSLMACNDSVIEIANVFYKHIFEDKFYGYVLYSLNKPKAERLCLDNKPYFDGITARSEDKLGINSFLLEPIQRLPRYNLLLTEMIRTLANIGGSDTVKNVKDVLTACCKASKQLEILLKTINEALSLNDIEECHEFNILEQGKFKKMDVFQVLDHSVNRRFSGKVFLFDTSLLFTELNDKDSPTKLQYRLHVQRQALNRVTTDNKGYLELSLENRTVTMYSDALIKTQEWIKLLSEGPTITDEFIKVHKTDTLSILFRDSTKPDGTRGSIFRKKDSVRAKKRSQSQPRIVSTISTTSIESKSSISSQDSCDLGNTRWSEKKYLHTLRNVEKHFVFLMTHNRKGYIDPLPYEIYEQVLRFRDAYDAILAYHMQHVEPEIRRNGLDLVKVCNLLSQCLSDERFGVYKQYAALASEALEIMGGFYATQGIQPGDLFLNAHDKQSLLPLEQYIEAPIRHLRKYDRILQSMVTVVVSGIEDGDLKVELMKKVADVTLRMGEFHRLVLETFKIHKKKSLVFKVRDLGVVEYSDLVFMEFNRGKVARHRVFLMESAVLAIRIRPDDDNEVFETFLWSLPYGIVQYRNSSKISERIKIYSKVSKFQKHSVIFKSTQKKSDFLDRLNHILERLSGFTSFIDH